MSTIEALIQSWGDNESAALRLKITSLEKWLYKTYEPDKFGDGDFEQRLERWIGNVTDEDEKRTLFKLIAELFYVGPWNLKNYIVVRTKVLLRVGL